MDLGRPSRLSTYNDVEFGINIHQFTIFIGHWQGRDTIFNEDIQCFDDSRLFLDLKFEMRHERCNRMKEIRFTVWT